MAESGKFFIQHAGYVLFPRRPDDLTSTTQCPACFERLDGPVCSNCRLDLTHPAAAELAAISGEAAASIERRLELIGRIRFETAQAAAPAVAAAAVAAAPAAAPVAATPPLEAAPVPPAVDAGDAAPRRHIGVQVILLIVGVALLAIGAIFFLVYAFITFGLLWRSVIIGAVTVAAFVGASLLRRRNLGATAEAIAALAVVFVYLDAFALRANDMFGLGDSDALTYWGLTLILSSIGFTAWHRLSGLRLPSIVGFVAFAPGIALLVGGLTEPYEDATRVFAAFTGLAIGGLVHPLAGRSASGAAPARTEKIIVLSLAVLGLVGAGFAALALAPDNDWAPAIGLGVVAAVALAHVILVVRAGSPQGFRVAIAALGAVAASVAVLAVGARVGEAEFLAIAPVVAAAIVALVLELVRRRVTAPPARSAAAAGAWSAGGVAAITLMLPLVTSLATAVDIAARGADRWRVPGDQPITVTPENVASVISLAVVVVLAAGAWALGGTLVARRSVVVAAGFATLMLAVPLLGVLWAVAAVWLVLGAVGVGGLIGGRMLGWSSGIRVSLAIGAATATALGYSASWASIDTWWYGSVGAVAILVAARLATTLAPVRGVLLGLAAIAALAAAGAEGWHVNERFSDGTFASIDGAHATAILAIALLVVASVLAGRALSAIETRVLFWISLATAAATTWISWQFAAIASGPDLASLVLPEFATSLVLGLALFGALVGWVLPRSTATLRFERIAASIAVAPTVAWIVDSFTRVLALPEFVNSVAPVIAALIVCAGVLAITLLRPSGTPRWAREIGVGLVAVPALFSAIAQPADATWLVLVIGAVTALLLAVSRDGLFASASPRKLFGWAALALAVTGLWWRLGDDGVRDLEPYVLPLAGALLLIALLTWRGPTRATPPAVSAAAPMLALAGLLVAILPLGAEATAGPVERAIVVAGSSAALLLLASFAPGGERLRPYLDVAAIAGAAGVVLVGFGRPLTMALDGVKDDLALDVWLAATLLVLLAAAVGQERTERPGSADPSGLARHRGTASQALVGLAIVAAFLGEFIVLQSGTVGTARAVTVLLLLCGMYVLGLLVNRAPFTAAVGWIAIGLAALTGIVAARLEVIDPLEWATAPIAAALLAVGAVRLRRSKTAGSWAWLAPGILVLLAPSLLATFTDQPAWRLVGLGVACVAVIAVGALGRLQGPLIIGVVVVLVHGVRTFAPQFVAVYQATEWWIWAVIGGAILLFLGVTFERRVRDLRTVVTRVASLR